ncbi:unnamed protein product, partial [marine sediment metagenome]
RPDTFRRGGCSMATSLSLPRSLYAAISLALTLGVRADAELAPTF